MYHVCKYTVVENLSNFSVIENFGYVFFVKACHAWQHFHNELSWQDVVNILGYVLYVGSLSRFIKFTICRKSKTTEMAFYFSPFIKLASLIRSQCLYGLSDCFIYFMDFIRKTDFEPVFKVLKSSVLISLLKCSVYLSRRSLP